MTTIVISANEYLEHTNDSDGICLACHAWTDGGVEPDAEGYICPSCREHKVMGAENALLAGHVEIAQ